MGPRGFFNDVTKMYKGGIDGMRRERGEKRGYCGKLCSVLKGFYVHVKGVSIVGCYAVMGLRRGWG